MEYVWEALAAVRATGAPLHDLREARLDWLRFAGALAPQQHVIISGIGATPAFVPLRALSALKVDR
jgi:hypothetical protein